ncbi:hypothetical protein [Nesterenkonia ebinurensis]|uniref:hypothetical protein n=1 Tax=Nesterenkonia ebinurensis TaxID=2608252 RepID=UPI00123D866F|nr:hypothetical protein [Nesterenkonia ebinurensis]
MDHHGHFESKDEARQEWGSFISGVKKSAFTLTAEEWMQMQEQVARVIDPRASELHESDSLPNDHFSARTLMRDSLERSYAAMRMMGLNRQNDE